MKNLFLKILTYLCGITFLVCALSSCSTDSNDEELLEYLDSYKEWQSKRVTSLKAHEGWLNLAGLFWLEDGDNSFGSDSSNSIVFPLAAPEKIGVIILNEDKIKLTVEEGVNATHNGEPIKEIDLLPDLSRNQTVIELDSLAWFIIKRGERYGIRLRNYNHPNIDKLDTIPVFPVDLTWRVTATYEPFLQPRMISVPNIIGTVEESPVPGLLKFHIGEQELTLYPMGDPDHFFLVFGDETSALGTYGGGRFLGVEAADEEGKYIIDFNRAYNPPCAFTTYATCPLPPKENILPIRVTAGEMVVEGFGHH